MLHPDYVDFSQSMRDLLPLKHMCVDVSKGLSLDPEKLKYNTKSKVFEENYGALKVHNLPKITPGSKFIAIKHNWLRENINNCECTVENITGYFHKADIFTKGLQDKSS